MTWQSGVLSAFGWYGGKVSHLEFLLPLLPEDAYTFVDLYGGSAAVTLNRKPAPIEVLNDLDHDLVTFFRVLRDDPEPLLEAIRLTPWSRAEHRIACTLEDGISDRERARRFFVRCIQTIAGKGHERQPSGWAAAARVGKSKTVRWAKYPERLGEIAERLLQVQIECAPALDLIKRYDGPNTLFYADPPYPASTRTSTQDYGQHEMTDDDHEDLAKALQAIKGRAAVSGYRCSLYDRLYRGWQRSDAPPRSASSTRRRDRTPPPLRQECLWTNYAPAPAAPLLPF